MEDKIVQEIPPVVEVKKPKNFIEAWLLKRWERRKQEVWELYQKGDTKPYEKFWKKKYKEIEEINREARKIVFGKK